MHWNLYVPVQALLLFCGYYFFKPPNLVALAFMVVSFLYLYARLLTYQRFSFPYRVTLFALLAYLVVLEVVKISDDKSIDVVLAMLPVTIVVNAVVLGF